VADKNAIAILVNRNEGRPMKLGYIDLPFIPMVYNAMTNNEKIKIKLVSVQRRYFAVSNKKAWVGGLCYCETLSMAKKRQLKLLHERYCQSFG
jgi:hypothetical protein